MTTLTILRIFIPATITFLVGIGITPFVTHFLYKWHMWKPRSGKVALDGKPAEVFNQLHQTRETGTPRLGGVIVWASVLITASILSALAFFYPDVFSPLAFISRGQTWVPLAVLILGSLVGMFDDLLAVRGKTGIRLSTRLLFVALTALFCGWWFYSKLAVDSITVFGITGPVYVGPWLIACFVCIALFIYAGGVIDGIDGLAGGVFSIMFAAYACIAFFQQQMSIAALAASISGGLLAFLWFNIPPARFYLSETGTMGLTLTLVVLAFLTDTLGGGRGLSVLPIIAIPLVATVLSNIIQVFGKKVLKRKIFRIAPLHHHFEALGWPAYKVTMRYWIVGLIAAIIGMTMALL